MTTLNKANVLDARDSMIRVSSGIKTAMTSGDLGPNEVKDMASQIISVLEQAGSMLSQIAEGVPADAKTSESDDVKKISSEGVEEVTENEEMKNANAKIASLETQLEEMKTVSQKKEIATKYASLWPAKQQTAKFDSVMKSKEPVHILTAKLEEAESILKSNSVKVASMPERFSIFGNTRVASEAKGNQMVSLSGVI